MAPLTCNDTIASGLRTDSSWINARRWWRCGTVVGARQTRQSSHQAEVPRSSVCTSFHLVLPRFVDGIRSASVASAAGGGE